MHRHFRPAVDGDLDQLFAAHRVVEVLVGKDGELRTDRGPAEIRGDVGESLEPVDIVASHVAVRMAEMVETAVWTGHAARHAHAGARERRQHLPSEPADNRHWPAWVDEFMGELQVSDAQLMR